MRPSPRRSNFDSTAISSGSSVDQMSSASPILGDGARDTPNADKSTLSRVGGISSGQTDQAVVIGVPTVDNRRPFGLHVVEQEKVVADQLHLVERVVHRHRL